MYPLTLVGSRPASQIFIITLSVLLILCTERPLLAAPRPIVIQASDLVLDSGAVLRVKRKRRPIVCLFRNSNFVRAGFIRQSKKRVVLKRLPRGRIIFEKRRIKARVLKSLCRDVFQSRTVETPVPNPTFPPTATPTATSTATPEGTSTPTPESTPTSTPTITPTPTPQPQPVGFLPNDIAVSGYGHSVVVGTKGDLFNYHEAWLACFDPELRRKRSDFIVYRDESSPPTEWGLFRIENPIVSVSRVTGRGTVLIPARTGLNSGSYQIATFDEDCRITSGPKQLLEYRGDPYVDMAVDDLGRTALVLWEESPDYSMRRVWLILLSETGDEIARLEAPCRAPGSRGVHVALNRTTGDGAVSCYDADESQKLIFRRFSAAGAWVDENPIAVPETSQPGGGAAHFDAHAIGMLDDGTTAILWQAKDPADEYATLSLKLYPPGNDAEPVFRSLYLYQSSGDAYRRMHPHIMQEAGSGYVLPIGESGSVIGLIRVDQTGLAYALALTSDLPPQFNDSLALTSLRTTRAGEYFLLANGAVHKNPALGEVFDRVLGK